MIPTDNIKYNLENIKKPFYLVLIFFIHLNFYSQTAKEMRKITSKDSLWGIWSDTKRPDTTRLFALNRHTFLHYAFTKPDSAFYFTDLQYNYAIGKNLKKDASKALNLRGAIYLELGEFKKSLEYFKKCIKLFDEAGAKLEKAWALNNLGFAYQNLGEFDNAKLYVKKAIQVHIEINDERFIGSTYHSLASIYLAEGDYTNALISFNEALKFAQKVNYQYLEAACFNNIGDLYYEISEFDKAIENFKKSLEVYKSINIKDTKYSDTLLNIGNVYSDKKDYKNALKYILEALDIQNNIGAKDGKAQSYLYLAKINLLQDKYKLAYDYYNKSYIINKEIGQKKKEVAALNGLADVLIKQGDSAKKKSNNNFLKSKYILASKLSTEAVNIAQNIGAKKELVDASNNAYKSFYELKNNDKAVEYLRQYVLNKDILNNEENQRELYKQQYKYEYEKQAAKDEVIAKERLKQQKQINIKNILLIVSISSVIIGILLLLYNRKLKRKNTRISKILEDKVKLENTIEKIEHSIAKDFHDNFGNRVASALTSYNIIKEINNNKETLPKDVVKFLDIIENSLKPLSNDIKDLLWSINPDNNKLDALVRRLENVSKETDKRYNGKINFIENNTNRKLKLPKLSNRQILLIVKESLNNAFKYSKSDKIEVIISVTEQNYLQIQCKDYGVGFNINDLKRVNGLNHLKERANLIDFKFELNSEIDKGTSITLSSKIPLLEVIIAKDNVA